MNPDKIVNSLEDAYAPEAFREMGHRLIDQMADYLREAREGKYATGEVMPVLPNPGPEQLIEKYTSLWNDGDMDFSNLVSNVIIDSNHIHHPRYIGHQVSAPVPLAALLELAGTLLNNGSAIYEMGPASLAMERIVVRKISELLGFGKTSDGLFTSGGSLGNLTAMLAAREWALDTNKGLELQRLCMLVSAEAHYSISRSLRILGIPAANIVAVPINGNGKMNIDVIPSLINDLKGKGQKPCILSANACSTATGIYDPLSEAGSLCKEFGLWYHVDGAHGMSAAFSNKYRALLEGIHKASSVVIDFHKMMLAPGLLTLVLFADERDSWRTNTQQADYLWNSARQLEWHNMSKRTLECTKKMMGFTAYVLLRSFSNKVIPQFIEQVYSLAREFAEMIARTPGFELARQPESNIVCFRYACKVLSQEENNKLNAGFRETLVKSGKYYIVQATVDRKIWLRVSLMNPFTSLKDLEMLLKDVAKIAES